MQEMPILNNKKPGKERLIVEVDCRGRGKQDSLSWEIFLYAVGSKSPARLFNVWTKRPSRKELFPEYLGHLTYCSNKLPMGTFPVFDTHRVLSKSK